MPKLFFAKSLEIKGLMAFPCRIAGVCSSRRTFTFLCRGARALLVTGFFLVLNAWVWEVVHATLNRRGGRIGDYEAGQCVESSNAQLRYALTGKGEKPPPHPDYCAPGGGRKYR